MKEQLFAAKQTVLSLLGGCWPKHDIDAAVIERIGELAAAHRLGPLLAWQAEGQAWSLPQAVETGWREARRAAALAALAQQAALRAALKTLDAAGIPTVALKGVDLAWRLYPEPGLRPMRDIDLLVPEDRIRDSARLLAEAGFVAEASDAATLDRALVSDHQFPAQRHAGLGVTIELHHRLTDPPGRRGYRVPQLDHVGMIERARRVDCGGFAVSCPAPTDLATHLIVHAAYGHRLDCGPLVLADLHFLALAGEIDWHELRTQASRQGWARGADLLFALTARWFGSHPAPFDPPPIALLAEAEEALLSDPAARGRMEAAADLASGSPVALGRAVSRRIMPDAEVVAREGGGLPRWAFWPVWATRRLARAAGRIFDRRAAREARSAARLVRWLDG